MDERQMPEAERPRRSPVLTAAVLVVAVAALAGALYVVARNLKKVSVVPASVDTLAIPRPLPPDTAFVVFRAGMRRKVRTLEIRCRLARKQLKDGLTPQQDSLSRECDSALALILAHVAAFDSVKREGRKAAAADLKAEYARARAKVNVFARSGRHVGEVSDDSLDMELKKLIGR